MANRVKDMIAKREREIAERLKKGQITQDQINAAHAAFDMDLEEFAHFQELKSLAVQDGRLTVEEGMAIYAHLGELPTTFNKKSLAVKAVLTRLYSDLIEAEVKARR